MDRVFTPRRLMFNSAIARAAGARPDILAASAAFREPSGALGIPAGSIAWPGGGQMS